MEEEPHTPSTEAMKHIYQRSRRYSEDSEKEFWRWYGEEIQNALEDGWDDAAAEVAGCHDCLEMNGITNPYRSGS